MFGNWLEKGKELAANIDKQLNESVGIEGGDDGGLATTSSTNLNDAWNDDDFNDDDFADEPTMQPIKEVEKPSDGGGWNDESNFFSEDLDDEDLQEVPVSSASQEPPQPETKAVEKAKEPADTPVSTPLNTWSKTEEQQPVPAPAEDSQPPTATGWEGDDDLDITENDEEKDAALPPAAQVETAKKAAFDESPLQTPIEEPTVPLPMDDVPPAAEPDKAVQTDVQTAPGETASPSVPLQMESTNTDPTEPQSLPDKTPPLSTPAEATGATPVVVVDDEKVRQLESQVALLQEQLALREGQLSSKVEQMAALQSMFETEKEELVQKVRDTKEEAKRRLQKAKERVEAMEAAHSGDDQQQQELIRELRMEGEKLARKQSEMEKAVRSAKAESRELTEQLKEETTAKTNALEKIATLESDLKQTKEALTSARKGESQAGKLESDLVAARGEAELKAATILSLEQQIKELKAEGKELRVELEQSKAGAAAISEREAKKLRKEHTGQLSDMESKLHAIEREAAVREDALRHEVTELRKRWQDAVRRADALSMDVQSSTAPLLRQLESMERQNRARASNWADLENKLRSELEENVIQNEKLSKERSELKTKYMRLERVSNEREEELKNCRALIQDQTSKIAKLETKLEELEIEGEKKKEEWAEVERLANEGVARVRSEMTQTVLESEERYRTQIASLEHDLREQQEKRSQLERQVGELLENAGAMIVPTPMSPVPKEAKPKKLRHVEGQAAILSGALDGLDSDEEETVGKSFDDDEVEEGGATNSFAAIEQLNQRLNVNKVELGALRKSLAESEKVRASLVEELGEARHAKEKLPLFESKVQELTQENHEMEMEIRGLKDDIMEVREMYKTQLHVLIEEKAAAAVAPAPASAPLALPKEESNGEAPTENGAVSSSDNFFDEVQKQD